MLAVAGLAAVFAAADLHADVRLAPALVGPATLRVLLRDGGRKPVDDAAVSAHVDMTTMEMDPGFKALRPGPHGTFVLHLRLSMPGHYHVEVRVLRPHRAMQTFDAPVFIDIP